MSPVVSRSGLYLVQQSRRRTSAERARCPETPEFTRSFSWSPLVIDTRTSPLARPPFPIDARSRGIASPGQPAWQQDLALGFGDILCARRALRDTASTRGGVNVTPVIAFP